MDGKDPVHPDGDSADSIAFRAAMRDDPSAPGASDEGGPVAHGRIELGYPFEDADVLADLFLSDGPTVARIGPGGLVKPDSKSAPSAFLSEPKPEARTAPRTESQHQTRSSRPGPATSRSLGEPEIELLLVGHLPVLGSAWVLQYAKHVAQHSGTPVGLIRLSGGEATIDLALPPSEVPPQIGPMPSIADAVQYVSRRTSRWIVRLDESADRATPADAASSIRTADRITVLTGADEAAVVGCYRVIKTLEPGEATPRLHVAVMGSNAARAEEAAGKLSRAAEKFLSSRVTSEACVTKITPGSSVNVYRGRPNAGHAELIALLRGGPAPAEIAAGAEPDPISRSLDDEISDGLDSETPGAVAPASVLPVAPVFVAADAAHHSTPKLATASTCTPTLISEPESHSLARHLDSLESLASRCPYAPEVELAVDPNGRLHLIARAGSDPGSTLGLLTTAKTWAEAHASIMTLAHPRLRIASAVCHLMTDTPKSVRRLGDTDLRLHLLTAPPGTAETGAGWVCVELN